MGVIARVPDTEGTETFAPVLVHITARVPADEYQRLTAFAAANDRATSAEIRRAIRFYLASVAA